jgi:hypothetical protein
MSSKISTGAMRAPLAEIAFVQAPVRQPNPAAMTGFNVMQIIS